MLYELEEFFKDYIAPVLVAISIAIVIAAPIAVILWLNWKMING